MARFEQGSVTVNFLTSSLILNDLSVTCICLRSTVSVLSSEAKNPKVRANLLRLLRLFTLLTASLDSDASEELVAMLCCIVVIWVVSKLDLLNLFFILLMRICYGNMD